MSSEKKRVTLSIGQKKELCLKKANTPSISNVELAKYYNIKPNTVSDILKRKSEYLSSSEESRKRFREPMYKEIDEAVSIWMSQFLSMNQTLREDILQQKAKYFADRFGITGFNASAGWLTNFKKRNNLRSYVKSGEAASAPDIEKLNEYRAIIAEKISEYDLRDVYNCDETALFWQLEPSKTLAQGPVTGSKKSKNRVTILLTCNVTGDDKLKPLFIHKYKNPRPLRGISIKDHVEYYWNKTAWMQKSIWLDYLKKLNSLMLAQRRKILLLVDNAPTHGNEDEIPFFSNIELYYLPPNTTAHLQPLDAGIINSFKAKYRKLLVENRVEAYDLAQELNNKISPVTIRNAIDFVVEAWNQVESVTIENCWIKTGILPSELGEDEDEENNANTILKLIEEEDQNELENLINKLPFDNLLSPREYISADRLNGGDFFLLDDEIVETVRPNPDVQDDDDEIIPVVSLTEALVNVENLINLHNFPPENFEVTNDELRILKGIRRKILRYKSESSVQLKMDEFINFN